MFTFNDVLQTPAVPKDDDDDDVCAAHPTDRLSLSVSVVLVGSPLLPLPSALVAHALLQGNRSRTKCSSVCT